MPTAFITGSAKRRLGWHLADALGRRGYSVVIHYNTSADDANEAAREFASRGIPSLAVGANLANEREVRGLVGTLVEKFGGIDVLVNCAAIWKSKRLEEVTGDDVRANFDANTLSTFLCCQHVGLAMVQQPAGGNIVNFGDWAIERPYIDYAAYFPSKGAIPALTRSFAVELGTRNPKVRVNCILPGPVMIPADLPQAERDISIKATLVKREGRPENIVQAVLHFIDNDFLTGVCLPVDGGRTIYSSDSNRQRESR